MVFGKLFKKSKQETDFKSPFNQQTFLVETIFDLIDLVFDNIKFKEALINERERVKYYRTDVIVDLFSENKGMINI